jgi:Tfp pilus assembly PilM family ATPase
MPFNQSPGEGAVTGLDLGHFSVKCAQFVFTDKKPVLQSVCILPLESGHEDVLKNTLHKLSNSLLFSPRHLRVSISGPSVLIRNLSLPKMTPQELKGAISFEAERHIPFPVEECILDFQILRSASPNTPSMNVVLAAAKKQWVRQRLDLLAEAGFEPELVDVGIFCFANAFEQLAQENQPKTYGLLDIGHDAGALAIFDEGELFFVREMPVPNASKNTDALTQELGKSLDYFENETNRPVERIFAAGGGALTGGLLEKLSESLGLPVALWNNPKKIQTAPSVETAFWELHFPELVTACGLGLRPLG